MRCFRGKNACVARALTFYFRMKHTIRGHERETNVETMRKGEREREEKKPTRGKRRLSTRGTRRERETLFVLRRAITGEERDRWMKKEKERTRENAICEKETEGTAGALREEMRDGWRGTKREGESKRETEERN